MSDKVREALQAARDFIMAGDHATGCCMCGGAVDAHTIGDGHAPVDEGIYHANMIVEMIDEALKELP